MVGVVRCCSSLGSFNVQPNAREAELELRVALESESDVEGTELVPILPEAVPTVTFKPAKISRIVKLLASCSSP